MGPGRLFGETGGLTQTAWCQATVVALEDSAVLIFPRAPVTRIVKVRLWFQYQEVSSKAEFQELLGFLPEVFVDFAEASTSQQRKIVDCFKAVVRPVYSHSARTLLPARRCCVKARLAARPS